MAGHKRPNGAPICPTDDYSPPPRDHLNSRSESQTPSQTPSRSSSRSSSRSRTPTPAKRSPISLLPKRGRWINPNFIENPPPQRAPSERPGRDTPETWVSTELNEEQPLVKHEVESDDYRRSPDVVEQIVRASISSSSSSSSSSSGSTRLQRTLTWIGTSTPLATVLSTPRHEITRITQRARDNGLHTAIAHFPQGNVKRETSALQRQSSWWVIVGRDAGAVTHLADLHEKDAIGALDYGQRNETIGAYPAEPHYHNIGPGILVLYGLFCASCATVFIIWWMSRV
ncbi:hypothetical protein QCA50_000837 [Cerrena zonata]|uniref:Uncharacterized protein n=1 Tax=Cerrena zonata TaxID=2478898 RepID=A0AAW0GRR6_9APHY